MTVLFDIETNGLYHETTEIHCISVKVDEEPTLVYTSKPIKGSAGTIEDALDILSRATLLVGHNIIKFDLPVIRKLYWFWDYSGDVLDTLLISKLKYPNIALTDSNRKSLPPKLIGLHSLKAWGYRLRKYKGDYGNQAEAWDKLTVDMVEYCRQDTEVTYALYQRLLSSGLPPQQAIWIEQEFAKIISRQEKYGVRLDTTKAKELHIELIEEKEQAYNELLNVFKPIKVWTRKTFPVKAFKKNGEKSQDLLKKEAAGYHYNEDLEWGVFEYIHFNPSSPKHRVLFIEHYFGKQEWLTNDKGNPKTGAEEIERLFGQYSWSFFLLRYLIISKLLGQLAEGDKAWLLAVDNNSRIHCSVDTLGAVSRRCTHSEPNLAQVPSIKKDIKLSPELAAFKESLGKRSRELFTVPKGKKLVGCDADALELRTLSHYMARHDNGKYAIAVDEGKKENGTDIHTLNQKAAGLPTRDTAKTFILT